jgi:ureidoglycolate lyase
MKKLEIKELALADFSAYGVFTDLVNPQGFHLGEPPIEFFRDLLQINLANTAPASFSVNRIAKRPLVVTKSEYHSATMEGILPLDGDILIHVGPATRKGVFPGDEIEIFHVPQGTMVGLKAGVWHHAPFAYKCDSVYTLIVLPERTYANDCMVLELSKEQQLSIKA